jgi:hypothetical protein
MRFDKIIAESIKFKENIRCPRFEADFVMSLRHRSQTLVRKICAHNPAEIAVFMMPIRKTLPSFTGPEADGICSVWRSRQTLICKRGTRHEAS